MPGKPVRKQLKKQCFLRVFRVRLSWPDQGARSRGLGRNLPELGKPVQEVLEDLLDPLLDPGIWRFAATFPSKG